MWAGRPISSVCGTKSQGFGCRQPNHSGERMGARAGRHGRMPDDPIAPSVPPPFTGHDRTLDEQLLDTPGPLLGQLLAGDAARLDAIRVELETGFRTLGGIERGVSIFGSARTAQDDPAYEQSRQLMTSPCPRAFNARSAPHPGQYHPVTARNGQVG